MSITIYVPCDSSSISLGANRVAAAIAREAEKRSIDIQLIRNGSRGLFWVEPLIEVVTAQGRIAYGPMQVSDVASLFDANFIQGGTHPLFLGLTEELDYLKKQQRLTFARIGKTDPVSLEDYLNNDGYRGLSNALKQAPTDIVKAVTDSGLRGRGGAAFPTGIKWNTVLNTPSEQKYIICNADEGDSGTFSDRMVMEGDPFVLIEGMTIAGLAVGATQGYIYLRVEYPHAHKALNTAIEKAYQAGYLGDDIQGSGKAFHLEVRLGAGAYICGEETSLMESLEGKRGLVRFKPPLPAISGLFGKPTVVNNVISLASVPVILDKGGDYYRNFGMGRSRGTLPLQLAGNIKHTGLVELAFGMNLREL
jgi:formate dehydrogenase iron-sulfur subunit